MKCLFGHYQLQLKKPYKRRKMRNMHGLWMEQLSIVTMLQTFQAIPPNIPHLFYDAHQLTLHGLHASGSSPAPNPNPRVYEVPWLSKSYCQGATPEKILSGGEGGGAGYMLTFRLSNPYMSSQAGYLPLHPRRINN